MTAAGSTATAPPTACSPVSGVPDPVLEHAWHPVALSRDLRPGGWLQVRLLGRTWRLHRDAGGLATDPPAWGVRERLGVVWLAPARPRDVPPELPGHADRRFVRRWLPPARSAGPAGPLADTLLDLARSPSGHAAASVLRAPFPVRLRLDLPATGAARTVLHLLHPEDADSTRVYTCLFLAAGHGRPLPAPDDVAAEVALQERVLAEALARHARPAAYASGRCPQTSPGGARPHAAG
ncbi:hypothetical protein [Geodermatophilus sp. SYSU D00696]